MRKKIVAGNWKMNKTAAEAVALATEVAALVKSEVPSSVQVIMAPPALFISEVNKVTEGISNLSVSAQNCHEKASGAYTGEISASMLASAGVPYVILGHSERRQYFNETNAQLAAKVDAALENNVTPIFCCGESLELRDGGDFLAFVAEQLTESLFHLSAEAFGKVVIAYEPIWAIGTGLTASSAQAQEMHAYLRQHIAAKYGQAVADDCSILYGGSCNAQNAAELFACADVDGGLIGGASLKAGDFITIAKSF
ncbi:triose-phosphate isomerase [Aquirufa rosea]|uniref:Triosephosphate isomerase n=1 Tax=Aquirufa rosea TaxID=2509241 RepID=A0A4Q1BZC6_9BACT|nr:triose-phosphate isomerase [Aquirufa rosea]RXK48894.1 triose-phosphate isomerase [Aquirufa rosea]